MKIGGARLVPAAVAHLCRVLAVMGKIRCFFRDLSDAFSRGKARIPCNHSDTLFQAFVQNHAAERSAGFGDHKVKPCVADIHKILRRNVFFVVKQRGPKQDLLPVQSAVHKSRRMQRRRTYFTAARAGTVFLTDGCFVFARIRKQLCKGVQNGREYRIAIQIGQSAT